MHNKKICATVINQLFTYKLISIDTLDTHQQKFSYKNSVSGSEKV